MIKWEAYVLEKQWYRQLSFFRQNFKTLLRIKREPCTIHHSTHVAESLAAASNTGFNN